MTTSAQPFTTALLWRKSSFSTGQNDCVEVASTRAVVLVRDSKNPDGDRLSVTPAVWASFVTAIKRGRLA